MIEISTKQGAVELKVEDCRQELS